MLETPICKICGSKDCEDIIYHQGIYRCLECGSVYRQKAIDYNFYEESDYWYKGDEELKLYQKSFFVWFEDYIIDGNSIEFGAADGDFTNLIREKIGFLWDVCYSEIKDLLRKEYENKNIKKFINTFEDFPKTEKFKNIFMIDVIEHINDPIKTFTDVYDLLEDGGRFYFVTGNGDCLDAHNMIFHHQEHVCTFTRKSIIHICQILDFRIVKYFVNPQGVIHVILEKNK